MLSDQKNNVERVQQLIRFHEPISRLECRLGLEGVLKSLKIWEKIPVEYDIFSIVDAIAKRGGPQEVIRQHRMQQIALSLPYYSYQFIKVYQDFILPHELLIFNKLTNKPIITYEPFIQHHLLPVKLSNQYYDRSPEEQNFILQNFASIDEYYNLKTLAYYGCDYSKLPFPYASKLFTLKKFLICLGMVEIPPLSQLKIMGLHRLQMKVCIIGCSFANIVLASKLSQLGIKVKIFDSSSDRFIEKWKQGHFHDVIRQGLFFHQTCQLYEGLFKELSKLGFNVQKLPMAGANFQNEQDLLYSSERINKSQALFFGILNDILLQKIQKENLIGEVQRRIKKKKLNNERQLILWHLHRYLMFHKMKKEQTSTTEIKNYVLKPQKLKVFNQSIFGYFPFVNCTDSYNKVQSKVELSTDSYQYIEYTRGIWTVHGKNQHDQSFQEEFTHVIFSDNEKLANAILFLDYRIPEIRGDFFKQGFFIFQQLSVHVDIHYLFRFKQKVNFKDNPTGGQCSFITIKTSFGNVHFILLKSAYEIYSITEGNKINYDYYNEILLLLTSKVLKKNCFLQEGKLAQRKIWFSHKDGWHESYYLKSRCEEKLFLNFSIHSLSHNNQLYSQHEHNCLILQLLLKGQVKLNFFDEREYKSLYCR